MARNTIIRSLYYFNQKSHFFQPASTTGAPSKWNLVYMQLLGNPYRQCRSDEVFL